MPSLYYCHNCEDAVPLRNSDLICALCGSDFIEETEVPMVPSFLPWRRAPFPSLFDVRDPLLTARNPSADSQNPHTDSSSPNARPRSQSFPRRTRSARSRSRQRRTDAHPELLSSVFVGRIPVHPRTNDDVDESIIGFSLQPQPNIPPVFGGDVQPHAHHALHTIEFMDDDDEFELFERDAPTNRGDEQVPPVDPRPSETRYRLELELLLGPRVANGQMDQILDIIMGEFQEPPPDHLTEEQIQKVPIVKVEQSHIDNKTQCSTCFEEFVLDDKVARLNCSHIFHPDCVKPWLRMHTTCPMCRTEVDPATWTTNTATETTVPQDLSEGAVSPPAAAPPQGMFDADELD